MRNEREDDGTRRRSTLVLKTTGCVVAHRSWRGSSKCSWELIAGGLLQVSFLWLTQMGRRLQQKMEHKRLSCFQADDYLHIC
ncbi:unnamed protein product [Gongylonema pulchrum]|uniref:Uncharacterized protein n=1 Tax=Gongylonema pulchrum TaxID=637853 RepID=A0A183D5D4_9BILA|nr:unnamed protein product [Gongylonema pulchrum]